MPVVSRGEILEDLATAFDERRYYRWRHTDDDPPADAPINSRSGCPRCGNPLRETDTTCPLCFMPVTDEGEVAEDLAKAFDDRKYYRWEAPEYLTASSPPKLFSRWHAGPLSFGPTFKLLATLLVGSILLLPGLGATLYAIAVYILADPYEDDLRPFAMFLSFGIVFTAVGAALLGQVWRRERIR